MEFTMTRHVNPYVAEVASLDDAEFGLLESAVAERRCRKEIGVGTSFEAADEWRAEPRCPECGEVGRKDGRTPAGGQRWVCKSCGFRYSALTGTILEYSKVPLPTWADFITMMLYASPLDLSAKMCGVSHQTAFEMRHRVFATVDGYQDRIVLRDRVWIDETYISDVSLVKGPDWRPMRGLSRQKVCIAVAIDVHKNVVAIACGNGKPSAKRIKEALRGRIADGSVIVHDKEKAHNSLVKAVKGVSEAYKADAKDPAYLKGMKLVNSLCSWIQRYLGRFAGMNRENLQSYLNWFAYAFRVKRDGEKWPETARVIRHLLMTNASYRSLRAPKVPHAC